MVGGAVRRVVGFGTGAGHPSNAAHSAALSAREKPKDFGTPAFFTPLDAYALQPYNDNFINNRSANSTTGNLNCSVASTESRAIAQINLRMASISRRFASGAPTIPAPATSWFR